VRDPRTLEGSVSLTLVFLSSLWVQLGLLGRVADAFKGIDLNNALQFFYACSALYFGTTWTGKDGTRLSAKEEKEGEVGQNQDSADDRP
jgi:hypothetical protein